MSRPAFWVKDHTSTLHRCWIICIDLMTDNAGCSAIQGSQEGATRTRLQDKSAVCAECQSLPSHTANRKPCGVFADVNEQAVSSQIHVCLTYQLQCSALCLWQPMPGEHCGYQLKGTVQQLTIVSTLGMQPELVHHATIHTYCRYCKKQQTH